MNLGKVGLILPGGGFKCAFQAGALQALDELGVSFDLVQGISGGAINVTGYFSYDSKWLVQKWFDVEKVGASAIFSRWEKASHLAADLVGITETSLYSNRGLEKLLAGVDIKKIVNHPTTIEIVVRNEDLEKLEVKTNHDFKEREKEYLDFITASACFPGYLPALHLNNQVYSDGCRWVLDSFQERDIIFVIDASQPHVNEDSSKLGLRIRLTKLINFLLDQSSQKELHYFAKQFKFQLFPPEAAEKSTFWDKFLDLFVGKPSGKLIVVIRPSISIPSLMLDRFDKGDITTSVKHGYERTKQILQQILNS